MFGSGVPFFYEHVLGLTRTARGWSSLRFAPQVGQIPPRLNGTSATLHTAAGTVVASWRRGEGAGALTVSLTVPPSATATVAVSLADLACAAADAVVKEGTAEVWRQGRFVVGAADAVVGAVPEPATAVAAAHGGADAVAFSVRSGAFSFTTHCP